MNPIKLNSLGQERETAYWVLQNDEINLIVCIEKRGALKRRCDLFLIWILLQESLSLINAILYIFLGFFIDL